MVRVGPEPPRVNSSKLSLRARRERTAGEANMAAEFAAAESCLGAWPEGGAAEGCQSVKRQPSVTERENAQCEQRDTCGR